MTLSIAPLPSPTTAADGTPGNHPLDGWAIFAPDGQVLAWFMGQEGEGLCQRKAARLEKEERETEAWKRETAKFSAPDPVAQAEADLVTMEKDAAVRRSKVTVTVIPGPVDENGVAKRFRGNPQNRRKAE